MKITATKPRHARADAPLRTGSRQIRVRVHVPAYRIQLTRTGHLSYGEPDPAGYAPLVRASTARVTLGPA